MTDTTVQVPTQYIFWRTFFNFRVVGFAFIRSWGFLMIFNADVIFSLGEYGFGMKIAAMITCIVLLAAISFFHASIDQLLKKPYLLFLSILICPAGIAIALLVPQANTLAMIAALIIAGVFIGAGQSILFLCYGKAYSHIPISKTCLEIPWSLFLASVLFTIVNSLAGSCILIAAILYPVISASCLLVASSRTSPAIEYDAMSISQSRFVGKLGGCVVLMGLAEACACAAFFTVFNTSTLNPWYLNPCLWSCVLTMIIIYLSLYLRKSNLKLAYRSIAFVMAAIFLLLPVFIHEAILRDIICLTAYEAFTAFLWILIASLPSSLNVSSSMVFGLGWSLVFFGNFVGTIGFPLIGMLKPLTPEMRSLIV